MSIPGVEGPRVGWSSLDGGVPVPPPAVGPLGGLTAGGEGSGSCAGART